MGKAPKVKETADAGAQAPAQAKTDTAPILSEGDGSSAGVSVTPLPEEGDAAAPAAETAPEVAQAPVNVFASPLGAPPPSPSFGDENVLALVLSPVLHDGEVLGVDEIVFLTTADFLKLAAAGAVTRAEVE